MDPIITFMNALTDDPSFSSNNQTYSMTSAQEIFLVGTTNVLAGISLIATILFYPSFFLRESRKSICQNRFFGVIRRFMTVVKDPVSRWIIIVQTFALVFCFSTSWPFLFEESSNNNTFCILQSVAVQASFAGDFISVFMLTILMTVREFVTENDDDKQRDPLIAKNEETSTEMCAKRVSSCWPNKTVRICEILGLVISFVYIIGMVVFPFITNGYGRASPVRDYCWLKRSYVRVIVYSCHFVVIVIVSIVFVVYVVKTLANLVVECKSRVERNGTMLEFAPIVVVDENGSEDIGKISSEFRLKLEKRNETAERFVRSFFYPVTYLLIWIIPFITRMKQTFGDVQYWWELAMFVCFAVHPTLNFLFFICFRPLKCYELGEKIVQAERERNVTRRRIDHF